jgi:hypothetical protein
MRSVKIALVASLGVLVIALGLALERAPMTVARANRATETSTTIASTAGGARYCQGGETVPVHTSALRIALSASIGPHVEVGVFSGGHLISSGEQGSGWTGDVVTVPVGAPAHPVGDAVVCIGFQLRDETVELGGETTPRARAAHAGGHTLPGRFWIEYLRAGTRSWASLVPSIVDHMGLGRAYGGSAIVFIALALLVAVAGLTTLTVLRELQ